MRFPGRSLIRIARWRIFVWTALAAAASMSCGPAKPVLIYNPPSVTIDSGAYAARNQRVVTHSRSFWEAMSSLDTGFVSRQPATEAQRAFANALGLVMVGKTEDAALALDNVRTMYTGDSLINSASRILLTAMLQFDDRWKFMSELSPAPRRDTADRPEHNKAGVEAWANAFKRLDERKMSFPSRAVVLPLELSPSGTPMIPVTINGKERLFWLDTGSSMSIIASDVAVECGVTPLVKDTLEVATTTGRVAARPASIAHLRLGGIEVRNATAMIVDSELMHVKVADGTEQNLAVKIDGVIGFDIMSRMDIRIDYVNRQVTLLKPAVNVKLPKSGRNLFWVGSPIVRVLSSNGIPLHFNLDTGAQETYSTDGLVSRTKARTFLGERRLVGGLSGLVVVHGRFVEQVHLNMAGVQLSFRKLLVFAPTYSSFVGLDGVLGSDIGRNGVVRIDATNGLFVLEPEKRLRPTS